MNILAILQNAYTDPRRAALLREMLSFEINPQNLTGKKLYRMTYGHSLRVTNACPEVYLKVHEKGKTDLERLRLAIKERPYDLFLSCGKQSNEACLKIVEVFGDRPLIIMPHPASRSLTNALLDGVSETIRTGFGTAMTYEFIQLRGSFETKITTR